MGNTPSTTEKKTIIDHMNSVDNLPKSYKAPKNNPKTEKNTKNETKSKLKPKSKSKFNDTKEIENLTKNLRKTNDNKNMSKMKTIEFKSTNYLKIYDKYPYEVITEELIKKRLAEMNRTALEKYESYSNLKLNWSAKCVRLYTSDVIYKHINEAIGNDVYDLLNNFMPIIRGMNKYLVKTKRNDKPVICYRKSQLTVEDQRKYKEGDIIRLKHFVSTSKDEKIAKNFKGNQGELIVEYHIPAYCYNAKDITDISEFKELENEILLTPYTPAIVLINHATNEVKTRKLVLKILDSLAVEKLEKQNKSYQYTNDDLNIKETSYNKDIIHDFNKKKQENKIPIQSSGNHVIGYGAGQESDISSGDPLSDNDSQYSESSD